MHSWHVELCIADQTVKTYIHLVAATPLRNLLPRTRVADIRIETESSSLGFGPSGPALILLPSAGPLLAIWLRPYQRLQLRLEPLFLP